jgi:DNA-binding PadR family transcriptional regulator
MEAKRKSELVMAALAPAKGAALTPVQVQKLFFLIDRNASESLGGPLFKFTPYHYGPFDADVYREIERLSRDGFAEVTSNAQNFSMRTFRLTPKGQSEGEAMLAKLDERTRSYFEKVSDFVRKLSFADLVSAVYKAYPEMRANSVFQER